MLLTPLAVDAWVTTWTYPHAAVRYGPARWDLGTFAPAGLICMPLAYARMHDVGRQAIAIVEARRPDAANPWARIRAHAHEAT